MFFLLDKFVINWWKWIKTKWKLVECRHCARRIIWTGHYSYQSPSQCSMSSTLVWKSFWKMYLLHCKTKLGHWRPYPNLKTHCGASKFTEHNLYSLQVESNLQLSPSVTTGLTSQITCAEGSQFMTLIHTSQTPFYSFLFVLSAKVLGLSHFLI